jgi:hypothetical protein
MNYALTVQTNHPHHHHHHHIIILLFMFQADLPHFLRVWG